MLFKLEIIYNSLEYVEKIIHDDERPLYENNPNIKSLSIKKFKYQIKKEPYLPVAIVNYPFSEMKKIMPANVECHPQTTLDDIEIEE